MTLRTRTNQQDLHISNMTERSTNSYCILGTVIGIGMELCATSNSVHIVEGNFLIRDEYNMFENIKKGFGLAMGAMIAGTFVQVIRELVGGKPQENNENPEEKGEV